MDYTKMSALVDKNFTVQKVNGYKWKKWDNVAKTMLSSDTYVAEHSKKWEIETDKGKMDVSQSQMGSMLEGVSRDGMSTIIGATFHVKSNGKTGMEIRYFINPVREQPEDRNDDSAKDEMKHKDEYDQEISLDSIPF